MRGAWLRRMAALRLAFRLAGGSTNGANIAADLRYETKPFRPTFARLADFCGEFSVPFRCDATKFDWRRTMPHANEPGSAILDAHDARDACINGTEARRP